MEEGNFKSNDIKRDTGAGNSHTGEVKKRLGSYRGVTKIKRYSR